MIQVLHIFLGIITPHIGNVVNGILEVWRAKQNAKLSESKQEEEVNLARIKAQVAEDRIEHKNPDWSDRIFALVRMATILTILALFVYAELTGEMWQDQFRQGILGFVVAHGVSSIVSSGIRSGGK